MKAAFDRPLTVDGVLHHGSGGRVTELLARPLLNAWWPDLAGFVQPLSGEIAATRALLSRLPFTTGYGLEIGMLLDVLAEVGLDAMAQCDIGERRHRHHSDAALGRMSAEVLAAALARHPAGPQGQRLLQYSRPLGRRRSRARGWGAGSAGFAAYQTDVVVEVLPPVAGLVSERAG